MYESHAMHKFRLPACPYLHECDIDHDSNDRHILYFISVLTLPYFLVRTTEKCFPSISQNENRVAANVLPGEIIIIIAPVCACVRERERESGGIDIHVVIVRVCVHIREIFSPRGLSHFISQR